MIAVGHEIPSEGRVAMEMAFLVGFLGNLGVTELIVIGLIVLLVFGSRIPKVMRSLGQATGMLKKVQDTGTEIKQEVKGAVLSDAGNANQDKPPRPT